MTGEIKRVVRRRPTPPPRLSTGWLHTVCACVQVVAYDGSQFAGFQFQPKARTVQGELEKAAARVLLPAGRVVGGCLGGGWLAGRGRGRVIGPVVEMVVRGWVVVWWWSCLPGRKQGHWDGSIQCSFSQLS